MVYAALGGPSSSVASFLNCLIVDHAGPSSAGSTFESNYNTVVANCTFVAVNAPASQFAIQNTTSAAGVTFNVTNSIFIGYAAGFIMFCPGGGSLTESYCLFSAATINGLGVIVGPGNVYAQTGSGTFVVPAANFRLISTSGAINAGTADITDIPNAVDIIGTSRPQGVNWDIGAYEYIGSFGAGTANGQATVQGVPAKSGSVGNATGHATVQGFSSSAYASAGTASGQSTVQGVSTGNVSSGAASGHATVTGYSVAGAADVTITLNPIPTQTAGTPFTASGTYTVTPVLQFSDDTSSTYNVIPSAGISDLGSTTYSFQHPGVSSTGQHNLTVLDTTTGAATAQHYAVAGSTGSVQNSVGTSLTALSTIIPAYVYQQYADDDTIQAFFAAYNQIAQTYLNWFNQINLPIYTGPLIVGSLLDWVGQGIYGVSRPTISVSQTDFSRGDFDTYVLNSIDFNQGDNTTTSTLFTVTDDIYKRILTWTLYKGDGSTFNILWLKRRIARFLAGVNGIDYTGPTTQISIQFNSPYACTITLTPGTIPLTTAPIFQAAVASGAIQLPFQISFNVLIKKA